MSNDALVLPRPYRKPYQDTQPEYRFDPYASTPARSIIKPGDADLTRAPGAKG